MQFKIISSCPVTSCLGEEAGPHLATVCLQGAVESDKVSPEPPFLQVKHIQLPQILLVGTVARTPHQPWSRFRERSLVRKQSCSSIEGKV